MRKLFAVIAASILATFTLAAPSATAQELPTMAPGVTVMTHSGPPEGTWCTLGAIGNDDAGRLLGLTAGHCIPPDEAPEVRAADGTVIGNWVTKPTGFPTIYTDLENQDLSHDGAFFEFVDGVPVTNQMVNGTRIDGIQSAGPNLWQHHCKFGQVSGVTCGWVSKAGVSPFESSAGVIPGDSGGPAYTASWPNQATGKVLGITSAANPNRFSDITNILADSEPQGVVNFTPIQY